AALADACEERADDRREDREAADREREEPQVRAGVGSAARDAEEHHRDRGDRVRLEEVGRHAGAVPTLSPTLSAITAGLRGSSSGMPASSLPTRSAPTSAPFVKMPPPRRAKMEMSEPPNARPTSACSAASLPIRPRSSA